jgi:hypothetical protein
MHTANDTADYVKVGKSGMQLLSGFGERIERTMRKRGD